MLIYIVNSVVPSHAIVALPLNARLFLPPNGIPGVRIQSKNDAETRIRRGVPIPILIPEPRTMKV